MPNNLGYLLASGFEQLAPSPIIAQRDPNANDTGYAVGQQWINSVTFTNWFNCGSNAGAPQWNQAVGTGGAGVFTSLTVTPGPIALTGSFTLTAGTNAVSIGADAADHSTTIGSITGASALALRAGTGASSLTTTNGTLAINTGTGALSISSDASATTVNIGTGAAVVKTISIGGTGANVIAIGNTQTAGSVAIGAAMTTGTIAIGGTGLQTGTITLGGGTGAQTVNVATGATGVKTVNIANSAVANIVSLGSVTGAASTTIQAGTGGLALNAAGAVSMQPATVSDATGTATLNSRVGVVTYTGFTTASAASQVFTVTNSVVSATSAILCTLQNKGANDAQMTVQRVFPAAGSFAVYAKNNGAAALNGDCILTFWVIA